MSYSPIKMKKESGGALSGIVIIVLILLAGGIYFYITTKKEAELNKTLRERAASEQTGTILDANVSGAVR